ncbi:unnamed protein product [Arabis nemorensis]|uniref:Uncharacterized protein n=1 Tax=Arabis nemorensis TaxID=586526 RepID=A0A565ARA1_9BRAS|nr:unnamed protein product [Arabis nemorensis]
MASDLVICAMLVSESVARPGGKMMNTIKGTEDWKDWACGWCFGSPSSQECYDSCRASLPGGEANFDWQDLNKAATFDGCRPYPFPPFIVCD